LEVVNDDIDYTASSAIASGEEDAVTRGEGLVLLFDVKVFLRVVIGIVKTCVCDHRRTSNDDG
jgi:hypothetical protein